MSTVDEQLTTGWEQHAPVEDTLLRRYLFHNVALGQAFAVAAGGHALDSPDFGASDLRGPSGYWNAATLLRPPSDWTQVLDEVERFFSAGSGEALLWSVWPTPDLGERGWRLSGHPPLLARPPVDASPLPHVAPRPDVALLPELAGDIERVSTETGLVAWEQAAINGYPLPELQPVSPGSLASPSLLDDDRLAFYIGRAGDVPATAAVSASASFASHGIASLAFAATLPAARGRGHWHGHAVARLRANPSVWTMGVFSDFSRPLAEHLGFVPLLRFTLWIRDRTSRH